MSQQNVEHKRGQAEAMFAALNARDFGTLTKMPLHQAMEFYSVFAASEGRMYRGFPGVLQWAKDVDSAFKGFHAEVLDFAEVDAERALLTIRVSGRARVSGVPVDQRLVQIWTWREGQLWRIDVFTDRQQALLAAGVAEPED